MKLLRWYRWKSRRFFGELEANQEQRKTLCEILEKQDLLLLKTLLAQLGIREHSGDRTALPAWKALCNFTNGVFMEMPSLIRSLMVVERVPPEVVPICVEFIPSLHVLIDSIPELLAQKTLGKLKYGLELVSTLALKYPMAKVEAHAPLMAASLNELLRLASALGAERVFALTVLGRLCIALPQSADAHFKPLIRMIEQASGKSFEINPAEDIRKQEIHVAMLKVASETNAFLYRRNITCLL
jgi:integrator complex subunit 2